MCSFVSEILRVSRPDWPRDENFALVLQTEHLCPVSRPEVRSGLRPGNENFRLGRSPSQTIDLVVVWFLRFVLGLNFGLRNLLPVFVLVHDFLLLSCSRLGTADVEVVGDTSAQPHSAVDGGSHENYAARPTGGVECLVETIVPRH